MSTSPTHAVASRHAFPLSRPIEVNGKPVDELHLEEPSLAHMMVAERAPSPATFAISLVAQLSGIPEAPLRRLKIQDLRAIEHWIAGLKSTVGTAREDDPSGYATFTLAAPVAGIERVRLREPDMEASVAVEKFEKLHEQTAAMIAVLGEMTIPAASRLKMRDVAVIEAWLASFVSG